ncbi:MAG: hypothetical protein DMG32_02695 [Acidobacteria bacterium]|nr:MAG: hypothetical protein DMG32_02695 [Acidobacteriota bacterium]
MSDVGGGYGNVEFGPPIGSTPESEAMFDELVAGLENGGGEAGPPIALDDFGNPVVNTGSAGPGYAVADENTPSTRTVQRGDSLYKIAKEVYGDANMWPLIAVANGIETPDLIKFGQELILPPKEGFDEGAVHELAGKFYADKEQARQAREEAMATPPASGPVATAPAAQAAPGADVLTEGRASMRAYWESAQDRAAEEGSALKYMGASLMRTLGDVGYSVAEMGVGVYNDPQAALVGAGKGVVNFGPEAFNAATNLTKMSLNGLTLLAEAAGVPQGTFADFRETDPYNITPLLAYNGKAEQGGALLANLALGAAIGKYGNYEIGGAGAAGEGESVLFGQRRISPNFSSEEGVPEYLRGRPISDVAADLRAGRLSPNDIPIKAFTTESGELVSINNRSLGALSEAGLKPTNVEVVQPTLDELRRLTQSPIIPNAPLPGPRIPVTPSQTNLEILRIIETAR